jgi:large subunit ribosomal protein L15e
LVDPAHNAIRNDPRINWIVDEKHREMRGLTSAGKKHRGLRAKGDRDNKRRPSVKANYKRRNLIKLRRFR